MKILFVGEAYGVSEDMFKSPFVGAAGRELANMLSDAEIVSKPYKPFMTELDMIRFWKNAAQENQIQLTNVFSEQPPDNNVEFFFDARSADVCKEIPPLKPGKYLKKNYEYYYKALHDLILQLKPNLVVALGVTAGWALTERGNISEIRGTVFWSEKLKAKILCTWHPAAVLRQWSLRSITIADFIKARRECEFPEIRKITRRILVDPTLQEIEEWLEVPATAYAVDIETGYALFSKTEIARLAKQAPDMLRLLAGQISMVGFARSATEAMVIPFMARNAPGMNYWPHVQDEIRAMKLLQKGLASPIPKIFQNGLFDMNRLLCAGLRTYCAREDTMLKHHSLFPELQKGLGFLGSLYTDETSWKGMLKEGESLKKDN